MAEYIETCGDCIHADVCERVPLFTEFSRENPAYCKLFKNAADVVSREVLEQVYWEREVAIEQLKDHGIPFGGIAPDVVEVVRCKDCVHFYRDGCYHDRHEHHSLMVWQKADDFCSYGERKNDDNI